MNNRFDRTIPSHEEAIRRIRELFAVRNNPTGKRYVIAGICERLKKDLKEKGITIDDSYVHSINDEGIKHTINRNHNLSESDFISLLEIIEHYDKITIGKTKTKLKAIVYEKAMSNGDIVYIEEIRTGKKALCFKTLYYKRKGDNRAESSVNSLSLRPKRIPGSSPSESKDTSF